MIKKSSKVERKLFDDVFFRGKYIKTEHLLLKYLYINGQVQPKISFVVPKSVAKNAADRNFLKRRGYSYTQSFIGNIKNGFVFIFFFGKGSNDLFGRRNKNSFGYLKKEIAYSLKSAKII